MKNEAEIIRYGLASHVEYYHRQPKCIFIRYDYYLKLKEDLADVEKFSDGRDGKSIYGVPFKIIYPEYEYPFINRKFVFEGERFE